MKYIQLLVLFTALWLMPLQTTSAQSEEINDPIKNFEALWQEFHLRYANFELKKVNWQEIYEKYRPMITKNTSNQELFDICCTMLQELKDGHVTLEPNFNDGQECGPPYEFNLTKEFPTDSLLQAWVSTFQQTLTNHGFAKAQYAYYSKEEEGRFVYRTSNDFGYVHIPEMAEAITFGKLGKALNQVFSSFQDKKGIIIDLRTNGGGWDVTSYKILGRLVDAKRLGHYKKTRIKGSDSFKPLKPWYIKPKGKYRSSLINPSSSSLATTRQALPKYFF